ncbi:MAG: invasion associated locus B family protein [Rhizobiales bacterium]|nr:invasion associated locus B family protein [Hyphomicrobiales bacterium]
MPVDAKKIGPLPSGAMSSETHGDWTVNCGTTGATKEKKSCTISQAQVNKGTGQRVFAIELRMSKDASSEGTILMPFGLNLGAGAVIKVDSEEQKLPFSTCLAQGCLVTVALPSAAIDAIRKAKTFSVSAMSISDSQVISFNISLNGFEAALERANQFTG